MELLAWLDYQLEYYDFESFKKSITDHLQCEFGINYDYERCSRKLHRYWTRFGTNNVPSGRAYLLPTLGSQGLNMSDNQRDIIRNRVSELRMRDLHSPRRLRSTSRFSETPRRRAKLDIPDSPQHNQYQDPRRQASISPVSVTLREPSISNKDPDEVVTGQVSSYSNQACIN